MTKEQFIKESMIKEKAFEFIAQSVKSDVDMALVADALKTLMQEPKTGRWIPRNSFLLQYKCSECGFESEKYNYCPNCGAKMVELQESED